jgi:Flp pilus assembly CpaE family ATPase
VNACSVAALYAADMMFLIANPDVPSVRNAQRLLERVRQLGAAGERVRFVLNRAAEPYPIPPK